MVQSERAHWISALALPAHDDVGVIETNNGVEEKSWRLDSPSQMLFLEPEDWHVMHSFTSDCVLMVLASTRFDPDDYIYDNYPGSNIHE